MVIKVTEQTRRPKSRRQMVRKQVYILPQQEEHLKRLAQERETSEAELIRGAIDNLISEESTASVKKSLPSDQAAWQALLAFVDQRRADGVPGEPYKWKREDGYEDERYQRPWAQPATEVQNPA